MSVDLLLYRPDCCDEDAERREAHEARESVLDVACEWCGQPVVVKAYPVHAQCLRLLEELERMEDDGGR